jgi:hypothetical protein
MEEWLGQVEPELILPARRRSELCSPTIGPHAMPQQTWAAPGTGALAAGHTLAVECQL